MANIGTVDFYIGVPSLPRGELEEYSIQLFDEWEAYVEGVLTLPDYSLLLEVDEGSIKAFGRITAALVILYVGIGQYGSFITGLETIHNQVRSAGDYFGERASAPFSSINATPKVRKRGESLARLQSLFVKVQRGEIKVEEAMKESEAIFGTEAETSPDFMNEIKTSLEKTPLLPQQIQLPLVDLEGEPLSYEGEKQTKPKPYKPRTPVPKSDLYRVEIWRENKKGKRNMRVISL
jgi:hypothetical protein